MLIKETLTKTRLAGNSTVEVNSPGRLTRSHPFSFVVVVIVFQNPEQGPPSGRGDLRSSAPQSSSLWNGRWKDTWLQLLW